MKIDGAKIAEKIYNDLQNRVARLQAPERPPATSSEALRAGSDGGQGELKKKNITPHLAVILVGENPASVAYVTLKQKKSEAIGAKTTILKYEQNVTTEELLEKVKLLNIDPFVHGILIQRPLPPQIDVKKLELATDPEKDVDGFHPDSPFTLPLPLVVVRILEEVYFTSLRASEVSEAIPQEIASSAMPPRNDEFVGWLKSQTIVVLGKGPTGGGPIIKLLNKMGINPKVIDSKTKNPDELTKKADIIISAVGRENSVKAENIKKGAILIGVGILRGEDKKLKGDYDEEKIKDIAGYYTPTPGGVGPVNVAMLMENLLIAAENQSKHSSRERI